jgi:hypothetical protein
MSTTTTTTTTSNTQPLETKFSDMTLKNNKQEKDQPLRRSTYNIFDAYDNNIPQNSSNLIDSYSIHPLQKVSEAYSMDLSPNQPSLQEPQGELNNMMQDLSLSPNNSTPNNNNNKNNTLHGQRSMPYCV